MCCTALRSDVREDAEAATRTEENYKSTTAIGNQSRRKYVPCSVVLFDFDRLGSARAMRCDAMKDAAPSARAKPSNSSRSPPLPPGLYLCVCVCACV